MNDNANAIDRLPRAEQAGPGVQRGDSERYFRMGAAVAVAGLARSGEMRRNSSLQKWAKGYLASFGITSMQDVSDLGIKGVYQYDFEALCL